MKYIITLNIFIIFTFTISSQDACFECHEVLGDKPAELYTNDIHFLKGFSCAECHGGDKTSEDMEVAMDPAKGFIGVPSGDKISDLCARCHSDKSVMTKYNPDTKTGQLKDLKESVHGIGSVNGRERLMQCTSCHTVHNIRRVNSPYSSVYPTKIPSLCDRCHGSASFMGKYNPSIAVDQLSKYRTSLHGQMNQRGNIKVAQCVDCHGYHKIFSAEDVRSAVYTLNLPETCGDCHSNEDYMAEFNIPTDQLEKFKQSVHGVAVYEKDDLSAPVCNDCHGNHAATPPGVESISKVCGSCHTLNEKLFTESPHKKAFDEFNFPECETCHGNHQIETAKNQLLGVDDEAICSDCHSKDEYKDGFIAAARMRTMIDSLMEADSLAKRLIHEAEQKGMEVEDAKFKLREINQARIEAKTIIHAFDMDKFKVVVDKGFNASDEVILTSRSAIDEFYFRRYGLIVAVLIITGIIVILYFYIKRIERKEYNTT